jgi:hypothetical protein
MLSGWVVWEARVATTEERNEVIDLTRADTGGDDITVVPGSDRAGGGGRGRGPWIWVGAGAAVVVAVVVVLVAALGSSHSNATVKTEGAPAPAVTAPPAHQSAPTKHATDTTIAVSMPATSVTHTTTAPSHNNSSQNNTPPATSAPPAPPGNNNPPATAPPQPLGPSALTWTAPTSLSISKDGNVLTVTVHNGTNRPAYTNTPLSCLQYGANLCTQNTQTLQPGATVTEHYTLDASQFTSTPTAVYVGGYYKVMISA